MVKGKVKSSKELVPFFFVSYLGHKGPPKVVEEKVGERRVRPQVFVVFDGGDVVKDEAALEGVPIDGHGDRDHHEGRQGRLARHRDVRKFFFFWSSLDEGFSSKWATVCFPSFHTPEDSIERERGEREKKEKDR